MILVNLVRATLKWWVISTFVVRFFKVTAGVDFRTGIDCRDNLGVCFSNIFRCNERAEKGVVVV
jgi:hypothetical protein